MNTVKRGRGMGAEVGGDKHSYAQQHHLGHNTSEAPNAYFFLWPMYPNSQRHLCVLYITSIFSNCLNLWVKGKGPPQ